MPESSHPWDPLEGESPKAYAAFELYRQLGSARSVPEAWRRYWSRSGTRDHAEQAEPPPAMPYFWEWSRQHRWQERALAWDAEQAERERDARLDRELQERAREHEEELRQRQLMREEARAARAVARRALMRLLQGVEAGQLDSMGVADLLPHLQRISSLLETGQKLDRLFQGEPSDVIRQETDTRETVATLVEILREFVPPERWEELAERLARFQ